MKILFIGCLLWLGSSVSAQNVKSPDEFLGYKLGERFTEHYRIVQYFKDAALARPAQMKLQTYGKTNEGKELLMAVISSPENMSRIEDIRKNNLRLTGMLKDQPGNIAAPAIVWLSYNVHGNEASSSEVSMKVLYELLSGNNTKLNEWLKNTVVIIDPCLNPDGRDRYVHWYNGIVGKQANPIDDTREHSEPWPGGRSNHYNFDLNRDWAWQTQLETQQRVKVYNQWMPSIHCDFHEQYPSNPYYFAPAAEPFHEVITPWQRSFQTTIGKNHARYFDANGWLYFTKEYFDLFYPAYGDTYPIYNGSIGMTYEQAGHSLAGLAIAVGDDTLTLADRIAHHFTTSLSTIEVAAGNAEKINTEFKKYFSDGLLNGSGNYKSYVLNGQQPNKLAALKTLFDRNQIQYSQAKPGMVIKGYRYFSGKEESYTTAKGDLLISALQPKANLVRVLFEPVSKLADSATYDITAWALPYAYGLESFAVKEKLAEETAVAVTASSFIAKSDYAYLVDYHAFSDGKLLADLLNNGIKVRFSEKPFSFDGKKFDRGTLVILKNGNETKMNLFTELVANNHATVTAISSGFMESGFDFGSDKIHLLKKQSVAMLTGETVSSTAAGEIWHLFDQQLNYPLSLINATELSRANLKNFDVIIIPDGNYKFLSDKDGSQFLKTWVRQGGKIIALENAASQMAAGDWGIKMKKEDEEKKDDKDSPYTDLKKYENRERDNIVNNIPGAIYKLEMDNSHPLAFGYPNQYFSLKLNDYLFEFSKDSWNVGVIKKENQVAGFVGSKVREKIQDGTVIAVQGMGRGTIVYFADNPVFRSFWENGKLLLTNAVFLAGQ